MTSGIGKTERGALFSLVAALSRFSFQSLVGDWMPVTLSRAGRTSRLNTGLSAMAVDDVSELSTCLWTVGGVVTSTEWWLRAIWAF